MTKIKTEKRKALVVEPDKMTRIKLVTVLVNNGMAVRAVRTGQHALRKFRAWPAALVVIDSWLDGEIVSDLIDQIKKQAPSTKSLLVCNQITPRPEIARRFDGLIRKTRLGLNLERQLREFGFRT